MKGKRRRPKAKARPRPNQPCSKNPLQVKCMNKKFSDEIKRIEGQLNNFVASSSLQKFRTNLRAELAEATRVVPDLIRLKATVEQEMKTNNLILEEALASVRDIRALHSPRSSDRLDREIKHGEPRPLLLVGREEDAGAGAGPRMGGGTG